MNIYLRQDEIQPGTLIIAAKGEGLALILAKIRIGWVKILEFDTGETVQANAHYLRRPQSGGLK